MVSADSGPPQDFAGKTALITGATRGIGLAIAKELAERGARAVITARKPDEIEAAVEEIGAADSMCATGYRAPRRHDPQTRPRLSRRNRRSHHRRPDDRRPPHPPSQTNPQLPLTAPLAVSPTSGRLRKRNQTDRLPFFVDCLPPRQTRIGAVRRSRSAPVAGTVTY